MRFFLDRGHRLSLITRAEVGAASALDPRVKVYRLPAARPVVAGRLTAIGARRTIRRILAEIKPDVVHVHDLTTGLGWMARIFGFHPYVVTTWGSDVYRMIPGTRSTRLIGRMVLGGADLVTVNSRHMFATAVASGARHDRVVEVQFGVDMDVYHPMEPDHDLRVRLGLKDRRVIFSPRQIAPLYDHRSVVRALSDLPPDIAILMSRKNAHPDYLQDLIAIATAAGTSDRIVLVPEIAHDDMPAYFALADIVVSVPRSDATAVTLLEALACGRPVVISDLPSPREWLEPVWPELIVPVEDPVALAAALRIALAMPHAAREARTEIGRRLIATRADRHTNMLRMDALYQNVVGRMEAVLS